MAGNATQAAIAAANLKLTGVGSPDTAVKGITDGLAAIQTHLAANETARQKLITDTNEYQKKIQEDGAAARLESNNTTIDNAILKSTESFVSGAADKSKLVSMGLLKMTDFNIYTQNGKSSYEILSKQLANMEAEYDLTIKRSQGYVNDKGTFIEPESGIGEDFLQKWQTSVARLGNTDMVAGDDGMGKLIVYETEVKDGVVVSRRDSNGNKIVDKDASSSILALQRDENKRSNKIYLNKRAQAAVGKGSGLGSYMSTLPKDAGGLLLGSLEDNFRKNPLAKNLLEIEVNQINVTDSDMLSVLGDNISSDMQIIKGKLTDAQKNDKSVTITVTDIETGISTTRQISKYVGAKMTSENVWAFQLSEDQQKAAREATMTVLWGSLEKTYKPGTKRTVFQKRNPTSLGNSNLDREDTFKLIDKASLGDSTSLDAIVRSNKDITSYSLEDDGIIFTKSDGTKTIAIPTDGMAIDFGKLLASELGYNPETYIKSSIPRLGDKKTGTSIKNWTGFAKNTKQYEGLGNLGVKIQKVDGVKSVATALDLLVKASESKMATSANLIIDKAKSKYSNLSGLNIRVTSKDMNGYNDKITIITDGVEKSHRGTEEENHQWLVTNLDEELQKASGSKKKTGDEGEGVKLTKAQWKALDGNENKTSLEYNTYFNSN